jgi:dipeptidase E
MKRLYLASNAGNVAKNIASELLPDRKETLFIKTASEVYGENPEWLEADRSKLRDAGFNVIDYTVTGKSSNEVEQELKKYNVIFISGGNTYYLLEKLQESNTSRVIKRAVEAGMPYIGSSAGSVIAGPNVKPVGKLDDIEKAPHLRGFRGLGLVDFVVYPHWGFEKYLDESIENMKENYVKDYKFILLTDNQFITVVGNMYRIEEVKGGD